MTAGTTKPSIERLVNRYDEVTAVNGLEIGHEVTAPRPAFTDDGNNTALVEGYLAAAKELGVTVGAQSTGGSSDGNFAAAYGVPTIDGLGPVGGGYHRDDEWSDVDSMMDRAAVVARLAESLASPRPVTH